MNNKVKQEQYLEELKFVNDETNPLEERIMKYLLKDHVTFAEIEDTFGSGDCALVFGDNMIIWPNLPEEVFKCITSLWDKRKVLFQPTQIITYLVDGRALDLPIAKRDINYKHPHWLPVVIRRTEIAKGTYGKETQAMYVEGGWDV